MNALDGETPDYWVGLEHAGQPLGTGFLVAHRRILTAAHCVRGLSPGADLLVVPSTGEPVPAHLVELADPADLALVELLKDPDPPIPSPRTGLCRPRDGWFGPYRPGPSDPYLRGSIVHHEVDYRCVGGATVRALQLVTEVAIGDFHGYSGGPVEREVDEGASRPVVGILLEQYPDRAEEGRYSNVLFAAALGEALRVFRSFDLDHLLPVIAPEHPAPARSTTIATRDRVDDLLSWLRDRSEQGLLDPAEVSMLRIQAVRRLIDEIE
jgi:hypothetical protein